MASLVRMMGMCHSVQADTNDLDELDYKSASPDEEALANAAKSNGYIFLGRERTKLTMSEAGEKVEYTILAQFDFTSERRRMSLVVRMPDGEIKMMTKGADSVVESRLSDSQENAELLAVTKPQLEDYSKDGLRTLLFAERTFEEEEWVEFEVQLQAARNLIVGREERVSMVPLTATDL